MNGCEPEGENVIQVYLLEVGGIRLQMEETGSGEFIQNAAALPGWDKLTAWQQEKVAGCARPGTRAQSMGGQLLLQYGAHRQALTESPQDAPVRWRQLSYPQLLEEIPFPLPLRPRREALYPASALALQSFPLRGLCSAGSQRCPGRD